jgi:hypothetical protein
MPRVTDLLRLDDQIPLRSVVAVSGFDMSLM